MSWLPCDNMGILLPEGLSRFAFRVLRPGGSEPILRGQQKAKMKNQKPCDLCGSAVNNFL